MAVAAGQLLLRTLPACLGLSSSAGLLFTAFTVPSGVGGRRGGGARLHTAPWTAWLLRSQLCPCARLRSRCPQGKGSRGQACSWHTCQSGSHTASQGGGGRWVAVLGRKGKAQAGPPRGPRAAGWEKSPPGCLTGSSLYHNQNPTCGSSGKGSTFLVLVTALARTQLPEPGGSQLPHRTPTSL